MKAKEDNNQKQGQQRESQLGRFELDSVQLLETVRQTIRCFSGTGAQSQR